MIRTVVIPDTNTINLSLTVPQQYIGKELEIIAFSKEEIVPQLPTEKKVSFTVLPVSNDEYKFNREEANER